jgi:RNA recognition motif-containing protein
MSSTDSTKPNDQKKDPPPAPKVEETESAEEASKKRNNEKVTSSSATDSTEKEGDVKASTGTTSPTTATNVEADANATATKAADSEENEESAEPSPSKKAKIATTIPPAAAAAAATMLTNDDVDEYTLDAPPTRDNTTDDSKIDTPNIILFGLHPLIKESPLKKMCEHYGTVQTIAVKSAFASRYGHVEFATVDQAKKAYNALNGASLLQKQILVQPTKGQKA